MTLITTALLLLLLPKASRVRAEAHPYGCPAAEKGKQVEKQEDAKAWCPPKDMFPPFRVKGELNFQYSLDRKFMRIETPITIHQSLAGARCGYQCMAYSDDNVLSELTQRRPTFTLAPGIRSGWATAACLASCWASVDSALLKNSNMIPAAAAAGFPELMEENFPLNVEPKLGSCKGMRDLCCIERTIASGKGGDGKDEGKHASDPVLLGYYVAAEILRHTEGDGWNAFGSFKWNPLTEKAEPCASNCQPYGDVTGFKVQNPPGKIPACMKRGDCKRLKGWQRHWQPLLEHENGSFWRQEHVTPHIGFTVKPVAMEGKFKELPDPAYKYLRESSQVIKRMEDTMQDNVRQNLVQFFDDKLLVRGALEGWLGYSTKHSIEDYLFFVMGISIAEHDATVQVWREKVRHDQIRPTSTMRYFRDKLFGKDEQGKMKAQDWEALIRVMPHSEFPSGSACLCTAYAEFVEGFVKEYHGVEPSSLPKLILGEGGFTSGCQPPPEGKPALPWRVGCDIEPVHMNMQELKHLCGQSRLWAGLHFKASVPAGEKLCEGIGQSALDYVMRLRRGGGDAGDIIPDWSAGEHGLNDPKPDGC